jgi:hypothetical protein
MNGAVSRARRGINRWLAPDPLFGYYFAPVWGTIVLMARPGKPQFSSGQIFTESSNSSPSSDESRANLKTTATSLLFALGPARKPLSPLVPAVLNLPPITRGDRWFESTSLRRGVRCEPVCHEPGAALVSRGRPAKRSRDRESDRSSQGVSVIGFLDEAEALAHGLRRMLAVPGGQKDRKGRAAFPHDLCQLDPVHPCAQ